MSRVNVGDVDHHDIMIHLRHLDSPHSLDIPGWVENVLEVLGGHGEHQSEMEGPGL